MLVATNRDLEEEVKRDRLRADLYHRLNVYSIKVPVLRERIEDIPIRITRANVGQTGLRKEDFRTDLNYAALRG